jgi:hypothetical protein
VQLRWTLATIPAVALSFDPARAFALGPPGATRGLPCRPTIACTADIVPPGAFELEAGALFRHLADHERRWSLPFLAKLTLTRWAQVQVGSNGATVADGSSPALFFDDVTAGLKVHGVDQTRQRPAISASATISIPAAPARGSERTYDAFFVLYVTKDLGPIHADLNFGANLWSIDHDTREQEWLALALSANLPPPFGVMIEGYYFAAAAPLAPRDGGLLGAVSLSPKPWLTFDFGGDVGAFPSTRDYSLFVGMSIVPVLLW